MEKLLPLVEAVERATGQRPHLSTIQRWCCRGSCGIKLECQFLGGRRLTTTGAVLRYMQRVTEAKNEKVEPGPIQQQSPRQQTLAANRAAKRLAEKLAK